MAVGIFGMLALAFSLISLYEIPALSRRQAEVLGLPDVSKAAPGEMAILDGRIVGPVSPLHDEFVAYLRERHARRGKALVDQGGQPFAVETAAGVYRIGNSDYQFDRVIWDWTDSRRIDEPPTFANGAVDIEGLVANGPVMAVGRLAPKDGTLYFDAESVVGLPRGVYAERLAKSREIQWKFAGVTAVLAALGLWVGWRGWRRAMR